MFRLNDIHIDTTIGSGDCEGLMDSVDGKSSIPIISSAVPIISPAPATAYSRPAEETYIMVGIPLLIAGVATFKGAKAIGKRVERWYNERQSRSSGNYSIDFDGVPWNPR
jgi:hypothetical protein